MPLIFADFERIFTDGFNLLFIVLKFAYAKKNISTEKNKKNQEARFSVENENESGERCFEKKKTDGQKETNYRLKC